MMSLPNNQRGLALVMAMLIVAVVSAISIELFWRLDLSIARSANRWHGMQARAYLEGAEKLAAVVLKQDAEDNQIDHLAEAWAQESEPFPTDEGWVKGKIEDAHGRLNINLLQAKPQILNNSANNGFGVSQAERYTASQKRFIRLLQTIPLDEEVTDTPTYMDQVTAINITDAVIDYLDQDSQVTGFEGAESDYYSALEPPLTIRNGLMMSISELSIVKGMPPRVYQRMLPFIIALPEDAKLNISTMSQHLLRCINAKDNFSPLTEDEANNLAETRPAEGFQDVQEFAGSVGVDLVIPGATAQQNPSLDTEDLVVQSKYFILHSESLVGEHLRTGKSLLLRENGEVITLRRTDANF